ncbi:hypothetical protein [Hymenobacter sp. B1770]|uniref:hypothetical protein n=1 Tax=Hymenobacter sp. B1770 TaxID=1718788 RepID=UPI003CEA3E9A
MIPIVGLAQQLEKASPYNKALLEADQETDKAYGTSKGIHTFTPQVRGVSGAGGTVYWVAADGKSLSAYQNGQLQWKADIAKAFQKLIGQTEIQKLALSSEVLFLFTAKKGHAEINRKTGEISAVGYYL